LCASVWEPMYNPTPEQADIDRQKAYDTGVPHGYVPPGDKYAGHATVRLLVRSELHTDEEYGGPFWIDVSVPVYAPSAHLSCFLHVSPCTVVCSGLATPCARFVKPTWKATRTAAQLVRWYSQRVGFSAAP